MARKPGANSHGPSPSRTTSASGCDDNSSRWMMRRAAEVLGVAVGVGHVVPVRQEDVGDAAQRLEPPHERGDELRRVDQPVARGVPDEVAVAAVRLRRVVAAVVDRLLDGEREVVHHGLHVVVAEAADGPGGAGRRGPARRRRRSAAATGWALTKDVSGAFAEDGRGDLPAGVAVDAGRVHEEVAVHLYFCQIGHVASCPHCRRQTRAVVTTLPTVLWAAQEAFFRSIG